MVSNFTPIGEGVEYGYPSGLQRHGDAYDFYLVFTARRHASAVYAVVAKTQTWSGHPNEGATCRCGRLKLTTFDK